MKIEGFTPGPWGWNPNDDDGRSKWYVRERPIHPTNDAPGAAGRAICQVSTVLGTSAARANAALIEQAPTLYAENEGLREALDAAVEALDTMLSWAVANRGSEHAFVRCYTYGHDRETGKGRFPGEILDAEEVLARIRGETP